MKFIKQEYSTARTFKDSTGINSFQQVTQIKDETESSCKLVSTLSVNMDADFSQLIGYAANNTVNPDENNESESEEQNQPVAENSQENNEQNNVAETTAQTNNATVSQKDTTVVSSSKLPQTGDQGLIFIITLAFISCVFVIRFLINNKKYKDIH